MASVSDEIAELEERLRAAELGPDSKVFAELLDDQMLLLNESGDPVFIKPIVVAAHQRGRNQKFLQVDVTDLQVIDHGGQAATSTCKTTYRSASATFTLKFLRFWVKKQPGWQIVGGAMSQPQ